MITAFVQPRESPTMTRVIACQPVESAQLPRVEIIMVGGEALLGPLKTAKHKRGVKAQSKLVIAAGAGADGGIAVQILCDEGPMSVRLEPGTQAREARPPRSVTGPGCGTGIGPVVVAQRTQLQPIVMPPAHAGVVAGLMIDLPIEVNRRPTEAAEQGRGLIAQRKSPLRC